MSDYRRGHACFKNLESAAARRPISKALKAALAWLGYHAH
jgi:hypothetical protein